MIRLAKRTPGAPLSEAELQQRRDAARARWEKAGQVGAGAAVGAATGAALAEVSARWGARRARAEGEQTAEAAMARGEANVARHESKAKRQKGKAASPWPMAAYARNQQRGARLAANDLRSIQEKMPAPERATRRRPVRGLGAEGAALREAIASGGPVSVPKGRAYNKLRRRVAELRALEDTQRRWPRAATVDEVKRFRSQQDLTDAVNRARSRADRAIPREVVERVRRGSGTRPGKTPDPALIQAAQDAQARLDRTQDRALRAKTLEGKPPNPKIWRIAGEDTRPYPQRAQGPVEGRLWADAPFEPGGNPNGKNRRTRAWPTRDDLTSMRAEIRQGVDGRHLQFAARERQRVGRKASAARTRAAETAARIMGSRTKVGAITAITGALGGAAGAYAVSRWGKRQEPVEKLAKASILSAAQRAQRVAAAKARWAKDWAGRNKVGIAITGSLGAGAVGGYQLRDKRYQIQEKIRAGREMLDSDYAMYRYVHLGGGSLSGLAVRNSQHDKPLTFWQRQAGKRLTTAVERRKEDRDLSFRGISRVDPRAKAAVGERLDFALPVSTSVRRNSAGGFGSGVGTKRDPQHMLVFRGPSGAPIYRDPKTRSYHHERELLLTPGAWRVAEVQERDFSLNRTRKTKKKVRHIYLEREVQKLAKADKPTLAEQRERLIARVERTLAGRIGSLLLAWTQDPSNAGRPEQVDEAVSPAVREAFERMGGLIIPPPPLSGDLQAPPSGPDAAIAFSFEARAPRVEQMLQDYNYELVRNISDQSREAIRTAMTLGAVTGATIPEQARLVRQSVGLAPGQVAWVNNYRQGLKNLDPRVLDRSLRDARFDGPIRRAIETGTPLTEEQIERYVDAYHRRTLAYRATTIARTEGIRATNNATIAQARAMIEEDPSLDVEKEWITAGDERVRHTHQRLNGRKVVGMETPFITQDEQGNQVQIRWPHDPMAPADQIINCRCVLGLRVVRRSNR